MSGRRGHRSQQLAAAREWLWAHTSQPCGDAWDADPELLDEAAAELLADLGMGYTTGRAA